jgi:hypothetical protein
MDGRLWQTVRERADHRCEYCCLPQNAEPFFAYHIEHIVARQHGGRADGENLAKDRPQRAASSEPALSRIPAVDHFSDIVMFDKFAPVSRRQALIDFARKPLIIIQEPLLLAF